MASAEQKKSYAVIKNFRGIDTKANRTAIDKDEFYWLENAMPVGPGNLRITPQSNYINNSSGNAVVFSNNVTYLTSCNISDDYIVAAEANGALQYYDITSNTVGTIVTAGNLSSSGVSATQYQNTDLYIGDPSKGLFDWTGNAFVSVGSIGVIAITNPGGGYTTAPTVTISPPNQAGGDQATAVATITTGVGGVQSIQVTNGGSNFTSVPTVTIDAPQVAGGTQATAAATIQGGNVVAITMQVSGSGYSAIPSVSITGGGGSGATANAVLSSGIVNSITLTNAGSGYTSQPTVTLTGGGGNVTATAIAQVTTFATGTIAIEVTNGGSGYGNQGSFYVTLSGGGYTTPANATAIVTGNVVSKIIMNNPGAGYTSVPTLTIPSYNGGTGANATVILNTNSIVDVASFSGRLWVAAGRNVYASSAVSPTDFTSVSAVSFNMVDSTLHNNIQAIISANNFLYIFGDDSINVFSNLQVTTSGQTVFTNTNVSASIGTKRIYAIFAYFRSILFMNDYGVYALVGSTTTKISDPLDGIFPYIDFSKPITAGQALLNNILCAVFNFYVNGSCPYGFGGNRYIQAVFFDKKWFITYQGAIQYVTSAPIGGKVNLYGTVANALYQLYSNTGTPVSSYIQTALQDMGDPIRTKQALKFGIEATLTAGGQFNATVDSENGASQVYSLTNTAVTWSNNVGTTIPWINNSSTVIGWLQEVGYYLYKSDAAQYGKYLGLTVTSNSAAFVVNTFEFEHELRVRF
jgi:hypothetical protein